MTDDAHADVHADVVPMSGAGNRFVVLDRFTTRGSADAPDLGPLARDLCAGEGVDGLLLLERPAHGADVRMIVYNADGSRPQACGNGLRCVATLAVARGHVPGPCLRVETDAGIREVEVHAEGGRVVAATAEMGGALVGTTESIQGLEGVRVELGNPHFVVFVEDADALAGTAVAELGPTLESDEAFPNRTNVEFCAVEADTAGGARLRVRVWERGVGETGSCGTGACAAAVAAIRAGRLQSPVRVAMLGGELVVEWPGDGPARLTGPVHYLGDHAPDVEDRRSAERAEREIELTAASRTTNESSSARDSA